MDEPVLDLPYIIIPATPPDWGWDNDHITRYQEFSEKVFTPSADTVANLDQALAEVRWSLDKCDDDAELAFLTGALSAIQFVFDVCEQCTEHNADIIPESMQDLLLYKTEQLMVAMLKIRKDGPSPVLPAL
jgi:hypothetical protein